MAAVVGEEVSDFARDRARIISRSGAARRVGLRPRFQLLAHERVEMIASALIGLRVQVETDDGIRAGSKPARRSSSSVIFMPFPYAKAVLPAAQGR